MARELELSKTTVPERINASGVILPALVASGGKSASRRFLEFFVAQIRNKNTRQAYWRACTRFLDWCEAHGLRDLDQVEPLIVATYIEELGTTLSAPSVKQHLAGIRMLFD